MKRILFINPNTSGSITDLAAEAARRAAPPGIELMPVTGRFGARYIASRAAYAIAGHAALDAYAAHGLGCDAVLLACFGDPGLDALKEIASVPVTGLAEASLQQAAGRAEKFAIVTGGERWGPMLEEFAAARGFASRLLAVKTVAPSGADIAKNPGPALALLAGACREAASEGAGAVILGGAGLAGLAAKLQSEAPVPLICSIEAGIAAAAALALSPPQKPASGDFALTPPVESAALSAELAGLLGGREI